MRALRPLAVVLIAGSVAAAAEEPARPLYFVRDVAPIFDRQSCSAAPCHGKFGGGQGGFQLSLMTLSPTVDFAPLERLVDLKHPEDSLLLKKPTAQVKHGGGKRFRIGSPEYDTILKWIQQGCRNPTRESLPVEVTVQPERFVFGSELKKGDIAVTAHFADGSSEDVTDRTKFITEDEEIAKVNDKGVVRAGRWGMTAVICRYVGLTKAVFVSMPRPAGKDDPPAPKVPAANLIDALVFKNLQWLNINPSQLCDDYTFLRRVHLDLVGALPNPDEIRAFVADKDPGKRARVVDTLLDDPRFVALRTLRLGDMLRVNPRKLANGPLQARAAVLFDTWLRDSVAENKPYNAFVKELLCAKGSAMLNGPANFYRVERDPQNRAENVAQAFLGVRLACARCHNNPFDRWTTDDYWRFAAFMAKVRERGGELFDENIIYEDDKAQLRNESVTSPNKGKIAPPAFLGSQPLTADQAKPGYLDALADWVTKPDNPFFAKAAVNRIWAHMFGQGIVNPVDDIRESSVAAVPALLPVLADQFVRDGYDVKKLIRLIATSTTYQLSSRADATNELDARFFSHFQPQQMLAQVLLDAINSACGTYDIYGTFPRGTTAVGLPLMVNNDFLERFGRSDREFLAALDPHVEPTLPQTLHMINSAYIQQKLSARDGAVAQLTARHLSEPAMIEELYLRTFCRPPTADEMAKVQQYVRQSSNQREAYEDLLWALITSREFLFIS